MSHVAALELNIRPTELIPSLNNKINEVCISTIQLRLLDKCGHMKLQGLTMSTLGLTALPRGLLTKSVNHFPDIQVIDSDTLMINLEISL